MSPAQQYKRPAEGFRFQYGGMKVNSPADAIPANKYALGINVRGYNEQTTRTRPGQKLLATLGGATVVDICAYTALQTNQSSRPRYLEVDANGTVWLDTGANVGQMGTAIGGGTVGASMLALRPNQSVTPYIYIATQSAYQKFSAPSPANVITQSKVGIPETQVTPGAQVLPQIFTELLSPGNVWSVGGTASAYGPQTRSTDIIAKALADPALAISLGTGRYSLQVSPAIPYQRGEIITFVNTISPGIIEEVIPPLAISMTIQGIYYDAQSDTGHCYIVPRGLNMSQNDEDAPDVGINSPLQSIIAQLTRGSLIRIGNEVCYVQSVINGPTEQVAIETSTVVSHSVGESIIGLPTIIVNGVNPVNVAPGSTILGDNRNCQGFAVAAGVGTLTAGNTGGSGSILARPTTFLNGWGPNAHVALYEGGQNQGTNWTTDSSTTQPYSNPQNAFDGNINTAAATAFAHTHQYAGCIWRFSTTTPGTQGLSLNINSQVPATTAGGVATDFRSALIAYSLDNGVTWTIVYNSALRTQQWDSIALPASQDTSQVQVMAFTDSHDDMAHNVFEINISQAPANPSLGASSGAYTDDDYLHFSVKLDNPTNLAELRLQLDVSDGTFTQNYYYASVTPDAFVPATGGTSPQPSQTAVQNYLQSEAIIAQSKDTGLNPSEPTVAGANQWTEIWIPIGALTRVGGDQTKSLANVAGIQWWVNAIGALNVQVSSSAFVGGSAPDVGDVGAPYKYRVVARSSITGAVSNPSPETRYGVNARRQNILALVPPTAPDPQCDTWDVYRYGGTVTSWRYIGSTPVGSPGIIDQFSDSAAQGGNSLDFDNYEPWPTIDVPLNAAFVQVIGPIAVLFGNAPAQSNWGRYLPGNVVKIANGNAYTLRTRPTFLGVGGNTWVFEFVENVGVLSSTTLSIYEPAMANQILPYTWGADAQGRVFAVGDPLRAGTVYFSKPNNADSAPDTNNIEICPPNEPLIGGEILDGTSYVASGERWWRLYPQNNPASALDPVQEPLPRGLAAPHGHTNDGQAIYWWAKDGIYSSAAGSLTDADFYNLFPHEGIPGREQSYNGVIVAPPDYSRAATFRLCYAQGYLYADYQDSSGNYHTLVLNVARGAWSVDIYTPNVSVHYHPPTAVGTLDAAVSVTPVRYDTLVMGTTAIPATEVPGSTLFPQVPGTVIIPGKPASLVAQLDNANDIGGSISCVLATREFDAGDVRAGEQWGDLYFDTIPNAQGTFNPLVGLPVIVGGLVGSGIGIVPMAFGKPAAPGQSIPTANLRTQSIVSLGGELLADFLGVLLYWTDDFSTAQTDVTSLFIWQPSFLDKPETTEDRFTDWDNAGVDGAKFFQGFLLHADTFNVTKSIAVRDADNNLLHPFTAAVLHDGESEIAYSFNTPFIAHLVRIEPQDKIDWRLWSARWIAQPTPEAALTWQTQAATHGLKGYMHVRQISLQYIAAAPVTCIITTYDGLSPQPIVFPATTSLTQPAKVTLPVSPNKGQNYTYRFTSTKAAQIYWNESEVLVGQWNRGQGRYNVVPLVGGQAGELAEV